MNEARAIERQRRKWGLHKDGVSRAYRWWAGANNACRPEAHMTYEDWLRINKHFEEAHRQ